MMYYEDEERDGDLMEGTVDDAAEETEEDEEAGPDLGPAEDDEKGWE